MFKLGLTLLRKLHFCLQLFNDNVLLDGVRVLFVGFRVGYFCVFEVCLATRHTWCWLFNRQLWDSWDWEEADE